MSHPRRFSRQPRATGTIDAVNIPESGVHIAFIGSVLWGLVAGLVLYAVLRRRLSWVKRLVP